MIDEYLQLIDVITEKLEFEKFYYKYRKLLYYIACDIVKDPHLAEDVVSETFMNLAKKFDVICSLGDDIGCAQIKRYAINSVRNTAINFAKKYKKNLEGSFDEIDCEWSTIEPNALEIMIEKEYTNKVNAMLDKLPEIYKSVMKLYIVYEYDVDDIAKVLNISKHTVYKRIQRARNMISKSLKS